jgi:flagellar basal-body rod protein FlgB
MVMLIRRLFSGESIPALQATLDFVQQRQQVLANNLANIDTPGVRMLRFGKEVFQNALQEAIEARQSNGGELQIEDTKHFRMGPDGELIPTPETEPTENLLFHDQTNNRLEQILADIADNSSLHQFAVHALSSRFTELMTAIKGRLT